MELFARGAMAELWIDPGRPDRVLKRIRADQATNPVFVHQRRAEAEALRRVRHDAVVRLLDEADGGLWLERASPLVAPRDVPGVRALVRALEAALDAVHAAGVLHRDVKLANVLATARGPVLADFGCARILGWDDPAPALGSAEAMSPRRLRGEPATAACDRWALGALAWTLCCGAPPFPGPRWADVVAAAGRGLPAWRPVVPAFSEGELSAWLVP